MGPGFRYHVATIVGVFMALGLGMVIGSSYIQEALVERLRLQLTQLNERFTNEIQPLREEVETKDDAIAALTSRVTRRALDKVRVAIVVTGDYADGAGTCVEALEAAGGAVQSVTKLAPSFSFRIETSADSVVSDLRRRRPGISEGREGVVKVLAAVIARGGSASDLRALTGARLIEPQGDYDRPVNAVVLIGGGRDETDRRWEAVDQPIIDELAEFGIVVVGVEPSDSVQSYIPAYQAKSISTVDNVDTPIGRAAMVLLVSGERGSYGTRATARDGVVPPGASEQ